VTTLLAAYRLTLYAPRSTDPTEATVLTPPPGAAHSDPFQVTTLSSLAGWKPYLDFPRGRTGRVNVLERSIDVGTMSFGLFDKTLTPGINASRWVSAFLGDANGDPRLGGLKCFVEESLDGGATWSAFWTGYVKALDLDGKVRFKLTVRDLTYDLTRLPLFQMWPHSSVTYVSRPLLCPIGNTAAFGALPATPDLTGTIASPLVVAGSTVANAALVKLDGASQVRQDNIKTEDLYKAIAPNNSVKMGNLTVGLLPNFTGVCRAHVTWNGGANQGDFKVGLLHWEHRNNFLAASLHLPADYVVQFAIQPLDDTADLNYAALPANGTAVSVRLFADVKINGLLIDVANPLTLLADVLNGKFSPLYRSPEKLPAGKFYGDVRRSFANTVSTTNAPDLPPVRFVIKKPETNALDWVVTNLLKPYGLALTQNGAGVFSVVDLRLPNTLAGVPTVTDADLVTDAPLEWSHDRDAAIFRAEGTIWEDQVVKANTISVLSTDAPLDHPLIVLGIGSGDFGEKIWKIDGQGYRMMEGDAAIQNRSRTEYLQQRLLEQLNVIRRPYAHGETTIGLQCRRTATVAALIPGQAVQLSLSALPNPATGQRGGTRLARVIEVTRDGIRTNVRCLDLGAASVAVAPTLGAPALGSDPRHTATITVTLNASSQPVEARFALTVGGSAPADTDPAWHAYKLNPIRTTGSITLTELTPGMRLWVQARSMPDDRSALLLPSTWATSTSLDLTGYTAPSGIAVTGITANAATVNWTNGVSTAFIEVLLASPTTDPLTRVATLLPGTQQYQLIGLAASTQYKVAVQHRTIFGDLSAQVSTTFTTTASITQPPLPLLFRRADGKILF
jgi:hypothetical protein